MCSPSGALLPLATSSDPTTAWTTTRERQVLELVARGATNREIGLELHMAEKTASVHVSRSSQARRALAHRGGRGRAPARADRRRRAGLSRLELRARTVSLPLAETFTIARGGAQRDELVRVEVEHDGIVGPRRGRARSTSAARRPPRALAFLLEEAPTLLAATTPSRSRRSPRGWPTARARGGQGGARRRAARLARQALGRAGLAAARPRRATPRRPRSRSRSTRVEGTARPHAPGARLPAC